MLLASGTRRDDGVADDANEAEEKEMADQDKPNVGQLGDLTGAQEKPRQEK